MEIIKERAVCFTGHRPEKITAVTGVNTPAFNILKSMLYFQILQAVEEGFEYFISGMARGVDIWAAQYVLELKKQYPKIKLVCAIPFKNHSEGFKGKDLWDLQNIINAADDVVTVSEEYSRNCYRLRNQFMVDNSSRVIAVVDNFKSGTGQTINYARKHEADIRIINVSDYGADETNKKNPFVFEFK